MSKCTHNCNQGRDCTCKTPKTVKNTQDYGNVWFADPEPVVQNSALDAAIYCAIGIGCIIGFSIACWLGVSLFEAAKYFLTTYFSIKI